MLVHTFDISIYLNLNLYHLYVFTLLQKFYTAKDTVNRANMEIWSLQNGRNLYQLCT